MIQLAKEPLSVLNQKLRTLEHDIAEISKITSSAAGERLAGVTSGIKSAYDKSAKATRGFVAEHPAKAALAAAGTGFALGFLVRTLWRSNAGKS